MQRSEDFLRSSVITEVEHGARESLKALQAWLANQRRSATMRVRRIPFAEMDAWRLSREGILRLEHASGRFFTVEGVKFRVRATGETWEQPVLNQPEVGLLGFLSTAINGVMHVLVQAKWEPGNHAVQLSPTVQATRSNYTQAHGGRVQPYIEHFANPSPDSVSFDALMPEHGRFFLRKFNRNIVVRADPDIALDDNFRWATLGQLKALLRVDDVVHMDTRSVIACLPLVGERRRSPEIPRFDEFGVALERSAADATPIDDTKWLDGDPVDVEGRPLDHIEGWTMNTESIHPIAGARAFSIIAVHVEARAREVAEWTQPMIEPLQAGFLGLLCREREGIISFLVESRAEAGYGGMAQLFPTVTSDDVRVAPLVEHFRNADESRERFSARSSEEGGRFFHYENRMSIVELPQSTPIETPKTHRWLTLGQLCRLGREGRASMELRNLLACVPLRAG